MPKNFDECTPEEILAYNKAVETRELTINASIGKLRSRNRELASHARERQENKNKIADLTGELAILLAMADAFAMLHDAINPPGKPLLDRLKSLLDAVNELTSDRRVLEAVVDATTEAARTFRSIQPA